MFKKSDKRLAEQALKGNAKAWIELVKRYEKRIFHYGLRMLPSVDDAMDLVQETFASVYKSLAGWNQADAFTGWLMTIAHRRCVEYYRRRKNEQGWNLAEHDQQDDSLRACPDRGADFAQQQRRIIAAMQCLPIEQRAVVEAKFFQQLTTREIAEQQGESENTIKSRLYAGLDKLKVYLEDVYEQAIVE